jgi:hypothetical protein
MLLESKRNNHYVIKGIPQSIQFLNENSQHFRELTALL